MLSAQRQEAAVTMTPIETMRSRMPNEIRMQKGRVPARLALAGLLLGTFAGCMQQQATIAADPARPVDATFAPNWTTVVEGRFLLLPVTWPTTAQDVFFGSGGFSYSGGAWSGFGKYGDTRYLNLRLVDLETKQTCTVFPRQVALLEWSQTIRNDRLIYANHLVLLARTRDTNNDGGINAADNVQAFVFDLIARQLFEISPEAASVEEIEYLDTAVVLVLRQPSGVHAIYRVDPRTRVEEYVQTSVRP